MDECRRYRLYPNNLNLRAAYAGVYGHLQRSGYTEDTARFCSQKELTITLPDDRSLHVNTTQEFLACLDQYPTPTRTSTHTHWKKGEQDVAETIGVDRSTIFVSVKADDLTIVGGLHDKIAKIFQARNPVVEGQAVSRFDLKPTVFLAHRFDDQGKQYAGVLCRFMQLLGFEVIEGEGYEARDIPAKVAERIRTQDIFVCLVSEGDPTWLLTEAAFAKGLAKYLVMLVQDDLPLKKGIIGQDYEHMTFPRGIVEKAFTNLLYALPRR